ncbi:hypothetical protein [Paraburkholderia hayleyella]|uniref:hypothetical protein n=1 Tax=Paraburkholderia hayleyella TaxID=2152889 RepID=UPI001291D66F|nr:hypothetical protein [Paraburkholderia hayleyella]
MTKVSAPVASGTRLTLPFLLVVVVTLGLAIYWRFAQWMPTVFYGDDLYNVFATLKDHSFISEWQQAFTMQFYEKYRPVFELAWLGLVRTFQTSLRGYLAFNLCLHLLSAAILFLIAMQLSNANRAVSALVALTFASSRFALYQVTQATGPVEGIALMLFLLTLAALVGACQKPDEKRWPWFTVMAFTLCIYTHERYIALTPVLAIALIALRGNRANRCCAAFACVAVALLNVFIKTVVLRSAFLVGTGTTYFDVNLQRIIGQTLQAIFSIVGFNYGPDFLAGHSIVFGESLPGDGIVRVLASVVVCAAMIATVYAIVAGRRAHDARRWYPLFGAAMLAAILVPPILTIRMEQRWLYAPFALFLLLLAWTARLHGRARLVPTLASLAACLSLLAIDFLMSSYIPRIFFISASTTATLAKRDLVDARAASLGQDLVLRIALDQCKWTLIQGRFFAIYEGEARKLYCADTDEAFKALQRKYPHAHAWTYTPGVSFTPAARP